MAHPLTPLSSVRRVRLIRRVPLVRRGPLVRRVPSVFRRAACVNRYRLSIVPCARRRYRCQPSPCLRSHCQPQPGWTDRRLLDLPSHPCPQLHHGLRLPPRLPLHLPLPLLQRLQLRLQGPTPLVLQLRGLRRDLRWRSPRFRALQLPGPCCG